MDQHILNKTKGDKVIWATVILLALVSMLVVYSSTGLLAYRYNKGNTEIYLFKQVMFVTLGLMIIYFAHRVNYTIYSRVATILFLIAIPLLIYTLFFGVRLNEGSRWIRLPIINLTFQTSDLAKLALFMYLGRLLSRKQHVIKDLKKGISSNHYSRSDHLHTDCPRKPVDRSTDRGYKFTADVYRKS